MIIFSLNTVPILQEINCTQLATGTMCLILIGSCVLSNVCLLVPDKWFWFYLLLLLIPSNCLFSVLFIYFNYEFSSWHFVHFSYKKLDMKRWHLHLTEIVFLLWIVLYPLCILLFQFTASVERDSRRNTFSK